MNLRLAAHTEPDAFWMGGGYELNLSFGTLRDKQWQRLIAAIWKHDALSGPFVQRFVPGALPDVATVQAPEADAAQTEYAALLIDGVQVGCSVLITRSLFECVTLQVPLGMFEGIAPDFALRLDPLDAVYRGIALALYDVVPFDLANMGYQCECRLVAELQVDTEQRLELFASGNFFARDDVLSALGTMPDRYPSVRPGLRWIQPGQHAVGEF